MYFGMKTREIHEVKRTGVRHRTGVSLKLISREDKLVVSEFPHVCTLKVPAGLTCIV